VGLNKGFWSGRRVLLTGHTGFKGAWLALWLEQLGAVVTGLALEPEDGGAFEALRPRSVEDRRVDMRDRQAVARVVDDVAPTVVLHLAAQALVGRGVEQPLTTFETNVLGTANLLDAIATLPAPPVTVVVTSDKVYDLSGATSPRRESDRLGGTDPYSASKAACELVVDAWRAASAGVLPIATARAGNVIGGGDVAAGRLLPDTFRALVAGRPLRLRQPSAVRPWQHVVEAVYGYLLFAERLAADPVAVPRTLNFGPSGDREASVAEVVEEVLARWGEGSWEQGTGSPIEATILRLDSSLAAATLGWRTQLGLGEAVDWTVAWHRAEAEGADLRAVALGQLAAYEQLVGP
jgi:CDP-glucose 4,6-dehydratase